MIGLFKVKDNGLVIIYGRLLLIGLFFEVPWLIFDMVNNVL